MASLGTCQECSPAKALHTYQDERPFRARRAKRVQTSVLHLATWNVRTLLDVDGPIETARQRSDNEIVVDERKIDQVIDELDKHKIDIAALQETRWFGKDTYTVGHSIILASGRPIPTDDTVRQRGEGVALVISNSMRDAWKAGGCQWKAWSPRVVSAVLKLGKRQTEALHVLSCYAPTFASSRADKDTFYDDLQQAILSIPSNECYVILGDFNARVGSRTDRRDRWWYERGPHGYGSLNEAGKELLSFLSVNEATVCNTWFMKKDIYKRTWQHPKSGQWHCIDHAIMRKNDRRRCLDATVVRRAQCNTDHMMLRVKVRMRCKAFRSARTGSLTSKFDVTILKGSCTDEAGRQTTKGKFACCAAENLKENWDQNGSIEDKWKVMKEALMGAASATLDVEKR